MRYATQPRRQNGFTLTEILIALALISFLLVGISRIFTMTSGTISTGQGVSTALRAQRAIGQSLSTAVLGYSSTGRIDQSDDDSGMVPLVVPAGTPRGAPFLMISSFRVPTLLDERALRTLSNQPTTSDSYATASYKVRSVDLNADGVIANTSTATGGEVVPLYYYGERNFRCDTISFFGRGLFRSQTGSGTSFVSDVQSREAWYWYGHLRVFNGDLANIYLSDAYGAPGEIETPGGQLNRNNRYASQFILGHMQNLLIEPTEISGSPSGEQTVLTAAGEPVYFIGRRWKTPTDIDPQSGVDRENLFTPFYYNSGTAGGSYVQAFDPGSNTNNGINFTTDSAANEPPAASRTMGYHTRTDIIGSGIDSLRQRVKFLEDLRPRNDVLDWWVNIYTNWNERPWINPFTGAISSDAPKALSRRTPMLAEACSQFIVEYAGDFIGQAANGTRTSDLPDGTLDFVAIPNPSGGGFTRSIRWYGMPRDVDGDGVILGSTSTTPPTAVMQSPDVIYLRDIRGRVSSFERPTNISAGFGMPPAQAAYHLVIAEAGNDPNRTRYTCAWGVSEFETPTGTQTLPNGTTRDLYDVPQMIRIIVEIADPKGRLSEPVTQEYVFPVKVRE